MKVLEILFYEEIGWGEGKITPYPNEEKWRGELEEILKKREESEGGEWWEWWEWEGRLRETMYKMLTRIIGREKEDEPIFPTEIDSFDEKKGLVIKQACFVERWDGPRRGLWGVIIKIKGDN